MYNYILKISTLLLRTFIFAFIGAYSVSANLFVTSPAFDSEQIELNHNDGKSLVFNRIAGTLSKSYVDSFSWTGKTSDEESFLTLIKINKDWRGSIITPSGSYQIKGKDDDIHIDTAMKKVRPCGGCRVVDLPPKDPRQYAQSVHSWRQSDANQIDLLVIYPTAVKNKIGSEESTIAEITKAVADSNLCFRNSRVALQLRLVHCEESSYSPTGNLDVDLDRLTNKNDGFLDNVHTLRDQYGADIVTLLSTDSSSGGLAKTLTFPSLKFADSAFNVCVWDQIGAPGYTLAHEIGHNLGCLHNREDVTDLTESSNYDYGQFAYGKRWFSGSEGYKTVMSYNDTDQTFKNSIPYFSNPAVSYLGTTTGNENSENNALALNLSAPYASNFRSAIVQGILPSVSSLTCQDGNYSSFTVRLAVMPQNEVVVNLSIPAGLDFQLGSNSQITFDSTNWNLGYPVVVVGSIAGDTSSESGTLEFSADGLDSVTLQLSLLEPEFSRQVTNFHTGTVVNQFGVPIEGVEFVSADDEVIMSSDRNGTFGKNLKNLSANVLTLRKEGYTFEPSNLVLGTESKDLTTHSFKGSRSSIVYVDQSAKGKNDGSSWSNAFRDLNDALAIKAPISQVWVAAGTYYPGRVRSASFVMPGSVEVLGGFSGTEEFSSERDFSKNITILSGDIGLSGDSSDNSYHVIVALDGAQIDGFIIKDGNASENFTDDRGFGAGLWAEHSSFKVSNCEFSNHWAFQGGGAVWLSDANATFNNCSFKSNKAGPTGDGGAIKARDTTVFLNYCKFSQNFGPYGGGAIMHESGRFVANNSNFSSNTNSYFNGGGALFLESLSGEISNCTFYANETYANNYGGAIKLINSSPSFSDSFFTENKSHLNSAGGLYIDDDSNPSLINNEFRGNYAQSWGGGIFNESSDFTISGGLFSNNLAQYGGAIATMNTQKTTFQNIKAFGNEASGSSNSQGGFLYLGNGANENNFLNCIFSGNKSSFRNGVLSASGATRFVHCTFYGNSAVGSGAISILFSGDSMEIHNSILWNNSDVNEYEISVNTGNVSINHSLLNLDKTPWLTSSSNNLNADPMFTDPEGNDGVVGTLDDDLMIAISSPAVDAGNGDLADLPTNDILGQRRDLSPDLGAYEYFSNTPPEYLGKLNFLIDEGNTSIGAITATDIDGHVLRYSIIGGEDQIQVSVDSETGVFSFLESPDFEYPQDSNADNTYEVIINISDGYSDIQVEILIAIADVDEAALTADKAIILKNGFLLSGGWKHASWFGVYFSHYFPWVYHETMGWIYIVQEKTGAVWMWKNGLGWLWTDIEFFPFFYQAETSRWAYLGRVQFLGQYFLYGEPDPGWRVFE